VREAWLFGVGMELSGFAVLVNDPRVEVTGWERPTRMRSEECSELRGNESVKRE
jgi:hypothetical protein